MKIKATYTILALSFAAVATPCYGQHLQVAGISGSVNVARLHTGQQEFAMGAVLIDPQADQSNDETGNGITLLGRWQVGRGGWYTQPEVSYVSTLETPLGLSYSSGTFPIPVAASGILMAGFWLATSPDRCAFSLALA